MASGSKPDVDSPPDSKHTHTRCRRNGSFCHNVATRIHRTMLLATSFGTGCCLVFRTRAAHANVCLQPPASKWLALQNWTAFFLSLQYYLSVQYRNTFYHIHRLVHVYFKKWRGVPQLGRLLQQSCNKAIPRFAYFSVQLGPVWLSKKKKLASVVGPWQVACRCHKLEEMEAMLPKFFFVYKYKMSCNNFSWTVKYHPQSLYLGSSSLYR